MTKIMIVGHGRHGKDSVAELLRNNFGLTFKSSSQATSELFIFEHIRVVYGYNTPEECYADRHNHRQVWYQLIKEYNREDKTRLGQAIFAENDIYVGIRDKEELLALQNLYGKDMHTVWVEAGRRLPQEPTSSMNIPRAMSDYTIINNGEEKLLSGRVARYMTCHAELNHD